MPLIWIICQERTVKRSLYSTARTVCAVFALAGRRPLLDPMNFCTLIQFLFQFRDVDAEVAQHGRNIGPSGRTEQRQLGDKSFTRVFFQP